MLNEDSLDKDRADKVIRNWESGRGSGWGEGAYIKKNAHLGKVGGLMLRLVKVVKCALVKVKK